MGGKRFVEPIKESLQSVEGVCVNNLLFSPGHIQALSQDSPTDTMFSFFLLTIIVSIVSYSQALSVCVNWTQT